MLHGCSKTTAAVLAIAPNTLPKLTLGHDENYFLASIRMAPLLPNFAGLARFRLPGAAALLLYLSLFSSTSVQGVNRPLTPTLNLRVYRPNGYPVDGRRVVALVAEPAGLLGVWRRTPSNANAAADEEQLLLETWASRGQIAVDSAVLAAGSLDRQPASFLLPLVAPSWDQPPTGDLQQARPSAGLFLWAPPPGYSLATSHGWRGAINAAPLLVIAAAENSQDPNPPTLQPGINKADPKPVAAPGPIPILGLVVALAWSRQLRKRMAAHSQELNEAAIDSSITISDNMETAQY